MTDSDLILDHIEQGLVIVPAAGGGGGDGTMTNENVQLTAAAVSADDITKWRQVINQKVIPIGKQTVLSGGRQRRRFASTSGGHTNNQDCLDIILLEINEAIVGPYLTGDLFTIADCHAFPFLWRLHQEYDLSSFSFSSSSSKQQHQNNNNNKIVQWLETCIRDEPAIQRTIQSRNWWWWW